MAVSLLGPAPADARRCSYERRTFFPGISDLRASNTVCSVARGIADGIVDAYETRRRLPRRVRPAAGRPRYRCGYRFQATRDGGYMRTRCVLGRRRVTMRLTS